MSSAGPNPLSYNAYIQQLGLLVPVDSAETGGVYSLNDANLQALVPQILNYAELRIQRDMDFLSSQSSNTYTLTASTQIFPVPFSDFFTIQTLEVAPSTSGPWSPVLFVSKEFVQNVYANTYGTPLYAAMYGDNFGNNQDTVNNISFGPIPNYGYTLRVTGTAKSPSLYTYASTGIADTNYTYISQYLPDMLLIASMIYVSAYQRNFSSTSDDPQMPMNYEKQYQALRLGAIPEENRRKQQGSGWSAYSTPVAATQTR